MTSNTTDLANQLSPKFEGFFLQTSVPSNPQKVKELLAHELSLEMDVQPFGSQSTNFDLSNQDLVLTTQEAWEITYRLRQLQDVAYVEPLFAVAIDSRPDWTEDIEFPDDEEGFEKFTNRISSVFGSGSADNLPESDDLEWALKEMKVFDAWERFFPDRDSFPPGQGIVIGHPDTGYRLHPEIQNNLLKEQGYDFIDREQDPDPLDELEKPFGVLIPNPGHGTAAASVIVSPQGGSNDPFVTGVAPGAKLIPYRTTYSVVLWPQSVKNLAQSIERAAQDGADVISVSMGAVQQSRRLREAVLEAQSKGVIVLGAAGNQVPWVVPPASIEEVIAVAASNAKREIWSGSSFGQEVDVTAPGESVWMARAVKENNNQVNFYIERGNGTTFAVALTAGVAALWLAHHGGREALAQELGGTENLSKIPGLFKKILRDSCTPVPDWDSNKYGQGLVNAEATLAAKIEEYIADVPMLDIRIQSGSLDVNETIHSFQIVFENVLSTTSLEVASLNTEASIDKISLQLSNLLNIPQEKLPEQLNLFGQELLFHLTVNPDSYKSFAKTLSESQFSLNEGKLSLQTSYGFDEVHNSLRYKGLSSTLKKQIFG